MNLNLIVKVHRHSPAPGNVKFCNGLLPGIIQINIYNMFVKTPTSYWRTIYLPGRTLSSYGCGPGLDSGHL